jgi:pimeloyl-ACP methyl ester carboxylesterase
MEVRLTPVPASSTTRTAAAEVTSRPVALLGPCGVRVDGRLVDVGSGRPVVFLHGLVGLNDHWDEVAQLIRHRVRCVLLEVPLLSLHGDDCSIEGVEVMTERFLSRHLAGEGQRPILVGNSFGGQVALRIALNRPDLAGGLVLTGASGMIEKSMVSDIQTRPSREWLTRKIGELFYDPARHLRDADIDRAHQELSKRSGARAMVRLSRSARRDGIEARVSQIAAPTLLIWGRNDVVTPPEAAEQFMSRLQDSRIIWFDECGHTPMIEKPEEFARALLDFAGELDRRPGGQG